MSGVDDLVTWMRQQLDDDERAARAWLPLGNPAAADREHIARHDPARVLAEVDAKRRVIDVLRGFEPNDEWSTQPDMGLRQNNAAGALRALALPYADRPGYRDEWRP
ncbi:DUF6221 family protein [Micromonospora sp. WMMD754]|uniref:DUF6221 family protein n=1 Tax=Micromonospora sp. WMMD754 TaxID=3404114 RepID=UPI003BF49A0B